MSKITTIKGLCKTQRLSGLTITNYPDIIKEECIHPDMLKSNTYMSSINKYTTYGNTPATAMGYQSKEHSWWFNFQTSSCTPEQKLEMLSDRYPQLSIHIKGSTAACINILNELKQLM